MFQQRNFIPAFAQHIGLNANCFQHVGAGKREILPRAVSGGIDHRKSRLHAVFLDNAVTVAIAPATFDKHLFGAFRVSILDLRFRLFPGQPVHHAERRAAVTFENRIYQRLTVNGVIRGLANRQIGGDVIADRNAIRRFLAGIRHGWKHQAAIVHAFHWMDMHAGNRLHGQRLRNGDEMRLPRFGGGKRRIFIGE